MENSEAKTPHEAEIKAAYGDEIILLKMIGLGDMNAALVINDFIKDCMADKFEKLIIDLAECSGMDSTFMGTLVRLSSMVAENSAKQIICNVSSENKALFHMLGVDQLLDICGDCQAPELEFTSMSTKSDDPKARLKLIHEAHKCLIDADESNHDRFGPFIKALESEMG
ncbi:MAG: STAS domain-containing protein [Planctomycetota bacterium]|jgi:anti-anti-sigma factor